MVFEDPRCLKCHRCCEGTEMILLPSDIARIEALGIPLHAFAVRDEHGFYRLKNEGGKCVFIDENGRCRIYERRPLGCRLYPLVFDELEGPTIDWECPLAREFLSKCLDIELGLSMLRVFLKELESFYGYRVDWRVFERGRAKLLSMCFEQDLVNY